VLQNDLPLCLVDLHLLLGCLQELYSRLIRSFLLRRYLMCASSVLFMFRLFSQYMRSYDEAISIFNSKERVLDPKLPVHLCFVLFFCVVPPSFPLMKSVVHGNLRINYLLHFIRSICLLDHKFWVWNVT
jgi:hypothetical protein